MGPGQRGGGRQSGSGGKTLISRNDIGNIILSGAARLGPDSLLKFGEGGGGDQAEGFMGEKEKSKAAEDGRRSWLRDTVNLGDSYF